MRLSDLLRMQVFGQDGRPLGKIDDVRLKVDVADEQNPAEGPWFLDGFMVGRGALGNRLGYDGQHVEGPALLTKLMDRLSRSARYVPLAESQIETDHVLFTGDRGSLRHPREIREDAP